MKSPRRFLLFLVTALALLLDCAFAQHAPSPAVPGEILLKFRPIASTPRRQSVLGKSGGRLLHHFDALDIEHVALPPGTDVASAIKNLLANKDVLLAQPNYIRHVDAEAPPNDPYWKDNTLWGLIKIQAQPVWTQFTSGDGSVVLADIDTGAVYEHPDLAANIWQNPGEIPNNGIDDDGNGYVDDVHGIDVANRDSFPSDDNAESHGTHTAGTMAAAGNNNTGVVGVSWNAKIVVCKAFDASGNGEDSSLIECLNYVVGLRRKGINLRATNNSYSGKLGPREAFPTLLKAAFDAAGAAGILNVCSAGNQNTNSDSDPAYPGAFDSPSIICVAASDQSDNHAWFSNFGATSVDLAAPGTNIYSTKGFSYGPLDGTSMSAPHVTGAVALLSQLNPAASAETLKSLILSNVDSLSQWTGLCLSGGRLNLFRAAQAAVAGTQESPVARLEHPTADKCLITWTSVPGMRYQVHSSASLTSGFTSLSDVMVARAAETRMSFTDSAATGAQKFYQVNIVP